MSKFLLKNVWVLLLIALPMCAFAQEMTYSKLRDGKGISINMELKSYSISSLNSKGEEMHEITLSGIFIPNDEGMPNLPRISKLVAIPKGAEVSVSVKSMETESVQNVNIAPALRIQPITENPIMDYIKDNSVYSTNAFYPQNTYGVSEVTNLRGFDAVIVGITPFQYNPVTKELIVVTRMELDIEYIGGSNDYGDAKYRSPWFDPILRNNILNYEMIPDMKYGAKSAKDGTGCEYLIVIPNRDDFMPFAEQIKNFRTKQGIYTKIMRLDEMNVTTTTELKSFFHNAYDTWDIPPVAVLLMGDHNTNMALGIPAETISHEQQNDYGPCITDNQYADRTGDKLPEMVFARMSAETTAQMDVLVSKVIEYETQPCMMPSYYQNPITALGWQTERWFQICSEVVGGYWRQQGRTPVRINAIYSGTPNNSWSSNQNTSMVVNYFGPNGAGYIPATPSELGGWSGGTPAQVVTAVNNGAFALQHRDHGFENGWGEPAFQTNHINQLNNVGKMTYLFTINCLTGKFNHSSPCFGEAFHRYTYNGQNAGCVGFLGPTHVSYSFVNDTYAWGMYDLFEPNFLPSYGPSYGPANGPYIGYSGNWMPAFGNVAGKYFLYSSNWPYSGVNPYKVITYQMFTAHSDVFLRLFTEVPQPITVSHAEASVEGDTDFIITASEGTLIALTANGEILDVATATGEPQTMTIPATLLAETEINVVITGQNYLRYEAVVPVIPGDFPEPRNLQYTVEYVNHVLLNWDEPESKDLTVTGYNIYRNDELVNQEPIKGISNFTDIAPQNGEYKYAVTALYGVSGTFESELSNAVMVAIDGMCIPIPSAITVSETEELHFIISWAAPDYEGMELAGYNVFRNDEQINTEIIPAEELSFLDENIESETQYCYQVQVVYNDCEEEIISEKACLVLSIHDMIADNKFQIFPNPTNGKVTIEGNGLTRVELFDIQGRKLSEYLNVNERLDIDINNFDNGIYLVKLYSEHHITVTKRLVIIK